MVRGTPGVKRDRTISVRVSAAEWAAWDARRATSGRAEMGAWVRAVVLDAEGLGSPGVAGSRAGDVPVVPAVNEAAYKVLVGAANNLNQLTRFSHQEETLAAGVQAAIAQVVAAARAVRGRRVLEPVEPTVVPPVVPVEPAALAVEPTVEPAVEPAVVPVQPAAALVGSVGSVDQPVGSPAQVDPWVSRRRRRVESDVDPTVEPDVDAGPGGGSPSPVSSPVSSAVTQEAPVGWESMSLSERARWLQGSDRTDQ